MDDTTRQYMQDKIDLYNKHSYFKKELEAFNKHLSAEGSLIDISVHDLHGNYKYALDQKQLKKYYIGKLDTNFYDKVKEVIGEMIRDEIIEVEKIMKEI